MPRAFIKRSSGYACEGVSKEDCERERPILNPWHRAIDWDPDWRKRESGEVGWALGYPFSVSWPTMMGASSLWPSQPELVPQSCPRLQAGLYGLNCEPEYTSFPQVVPVRQWAKQLRHQIRCSRAHFHFLKVQGIPQYGAEEGRVSSPHSLGFYR